MDASSSLTAPPAAAPALAPAEPALQALVDQVQQARAQRTPLCIQGAGSKRFYGGVPQGRLLDTRALRGITSHEPSELVVTVRAGTPLAELEAALAVHGQHLPFEPPRFAASAAADVADAAGSTSGGLLGGTVGGMVAAGLSGPSRAAVGSVRDHLLGVVLLNGRGELLRFGGQVMKNVAGYDVSRLMAGALGVLGVLCELSLKVLPVAPASATLCFDLDQAQALARLARWAGLPLPVNASAWHQGRLWLRLRGAQAAVQAAAASLGGERLAEADAQAFWDSVRDQRHRFFTQAEAAVGAGAAAGDRVGLWRLSVPATTPAQAFDALGPAVRMADAPHAGGGASGHTAHRSADGAGPGLFIEWGGALRWWCGSAPAEQVRRLAERAGGHATLYRALDKSAGAFAPLSPPLARIHQGLVQRFDPDGVFNPGRLYADLPTGARTAPQAQRQA